MQEWSAESFDALVADPDAKRDFIQLPSPVPMKRQGSRVFNLMRSARHRSTDHIRGLTRSGTSVVSNCNSERFVSTTPAATAAANVYGASLSTAGKNYRWKMTGQAGSLTCMAPEVCFVPIHVRLAVSLCLYYRVPVLVAIEEVMALPDCRCGRY